MDISDFNEKGDMKIKHGGQLEDLSEQYDIDPAKIIDFSVSLNPLGTPKSIIRLLKRQIGLIGRYPDIECRYIKRKLASHLCLSSENIIVGNGSNELIYLIFRAYSRSRVLIVHPTYSEYERGARACGASVDRFILKWQDGFNLDIREVVKISREYDLILLCNPNNPTGHTIVNKESMFELLASAPQTLFVVDEAFIDFVEDPIEYQMLTYAGCFCNLITLRSMTKFFAIPGLRLGYLASNAQIVRTLEQVREPWSVNTLAQLAGEHLLDQFDYINNSFKLVKEERMFLTDEISRLGWLYVYPSQANFLLVRIDVDGLNSLKLSELLMKDGIAIRDCSDFIGLDDRFFRIAVRGHNDNRKLVKSLQRIGKDLL